MGEAALNVDMEFFIDSANNIDLAEFGQHLECHDLHIVRIYLIGDMEDELISLMFPDGDYPECHGPEMSHRFMQYLHENFDNDTIEVIVIPIIIHLHHFKIN